MNINKYILQKFYSEYHNIFPQHISKEFWHICNIITEIIPLYIFAHMNTDLSIDHHKIKNVIVWKYEDINEKDGFPLFGWKKCR
jgi:hypothetical protein